MTTSYRILHFESYEVHLNLKGTILFACVCAVFSVSERFIRPHRTYDTEDNTLSMQIATQQVAKGFLLLTKLL